MKISFNPSNSNKNILDLIKNNKDIIFDLKGHSIFARGVEFKGTDTNTWRDIKINNVSIGSHTLDLQNGSNTTLTNTNGVVTINSTWRPVVDNLTSDSTTSSLSAKQGKVLKALIDGKSNSDHNHDGRYVRYYAVTTLDCNNLAAGLTAAGVSATNAAHTNHSAFLYISDVRTPFQIQIPDSNVPYIYKRYYSSGKWSGWFKLNAGYADSAGSVAWANVTGKPSSYTPSAHTHAWNSLTHSSTTENQAILTNGKANGWKLQTLNIARWDNAANNAHSHANKSVLDGITSALVNSWNTAYNFVSNITGTDTDKVINKWEEIVNFLAGITEDNKLNTLLNSKLSIQQLSAKDILTTKTNNALFWVDTKGNASTITTGPFTDHPYALLSVTNYNQNAENHKFFYRSRLAFSSAGDIKVASCHHEYEYQQDETWYNVLTSKNSGISGSTIKLNGTSITVYSSGTADGRYVKKSGDTMSGVLTIDTTNFGTLTIKRNDDANGASIQFRGKSSVYGYIGLNNSTKDKQFLRWSSDTSRVYTILDTSSTYISNGKGIINGTTITQVDNATNSTNSTNARKLVNWYSARPTSLNAQFGDGSLRIFYATSSTTEGKPAEAHILHLAWDNTGGYDAQLAVHVRSGKVSTRAQNGGTWQPWKTLAFTTDIPSSLKNPYSFNVFGVVYDGSAAKTVTTSNFISQVNEGTSTITDGTMLITSCASNSGFADTNAVNVPYKRKAIHLWEYIKAKTDSRYYTESEVNSLLDAKLNRQNLSYGTWNPRGYHLAADYHYNGGDLSISESGGKIHVSVNGYFWQNEGQYRVLDTSDIGDIRDSVTLHQYLAATDAAWYPLVWGGDTHQNTSDSTGAVYKSYDNLSWQTSSQTLYATNIQTNNIKNLSIGGGIYWNPNVESASDGSDAASITLVRQGVAGGTTLVLSQMNDTNDTIQFKTNTAARLYHNSYPILTTQNTYVSNNKGYIYGNEITQVNNSDTLDNWHKDNIQWTGYITSSNSLSSYWFKMYQITVTGHQYNDITITFLVSEGYSKHFSIFHLKIRQNGTNHSGNYNLGVELRELVGNLRDKVVAYYNNSTGDVQLWGNPNVQYNTMNYTVLKKTTRTATDSSSLGILTAQSFSSVQTPPSTGYTRVTMARVGSVSYSDSTGSVHWNNVTNKPSTFNPAAHTHTVFKNNLMIKGTNGISDSASIHLGIGDSNTGFKWISDGVCQIYANNVAVGQWTSGGMNWFKNPTVNGNKVWNAGNDGSGSGLDADTLDGYHAASFVKMKQFRFNQYMEGFWTKILTITINSTSDIQPVIAFNWIPSECAREVWAEFTINWRSNSPIFYAIWKGTAVRTLTCVNSSGNIWNVWVQGDKNSYDPFGEVQVTYAHHISSYNGGSLGYSDSDPGGTRCTLGGYVNYARSTGNADTVDGQHASAFSYKSWWHWYGKDGQPNWLWGGNNENDYYVYNPSNFRVAYAASAGNADTTDGVHITWAGELTSTNHLVAWEADGSALRDINPANVTVGNSDKLDGIHANGLLTALSNSDKGISITVGGTTKSVSNISVNYASSAGNADTVDGVHVNQLCRIYTFNVHDHIIKVGTLTSGQSGHVCKLRFNSGIGYNAANQDKAMTVVIRASNGGANSKGFYFEAHSESYRAGAFTTFYLHQTSKTQCELYMAAFNYSGQSTYEISFSAGDLWTNEMSVQSALPTSNIFTLPNYQIAYNDYNVASATKLAAARTIWGQSFDGTADVNGTIYINNSDSSNGAIRLNNDVNSNARISAINDQVIFNTGNAIRFGETAWDQNQWAGLKYTHSNKTIYLGIADNSIFNANSAQGGGTLNLRAGISDIDLNSGTSIRGLPTNGSPYSSIITLRDTSISLSAYGDISMSTGPGTINLSSGYSGIKLSCQGNNASISPEGFKVEASQGAYLNSGNSGNVWLCQGGGNVSIGYSSPSYKLDVNGQMRSDGFHHYYADSNNYVLLAGGGYLIHKTGSTTWSTAIQFGNYVWIILQMDNATSGRQVVPNNIAKPTKNIYVVDIQTGNYNNSRNGIYRIAPDGNLYHVDGPDGQRLYTTICYVAS